MRRMLDFWLGELSPAWSLLERRARVLEVIDETHDVKTFVLAARLPAARAGQYVPIEVTIDGARVRRTYSLSRLGRRRIAITVKRVPGGRVSGWMHDNLRKGSILVVGDPAGDFTMPDAPRVLLVGGGSGMTPMRALAAEGHPDLVLVQCARSPRDVLFPTLPQRVHTGVLDEATLRALVPDLDERTTLVCGPPGLIDAVTAFVPTARSERFVRPRPSTPGPRRPAAETGMNVHSALPGVAVRLARAGRTVTLRGLGPLLEELEAAGERPAHGCRMGICHTCRVRKRSGATVDLVTGKTSDGAGEDIRLCITAARSDLEVDL